MAEYIQARGLAELRQALLKFPARIQKRALNKAMSAGARVVASFAKRVAPTRTGALKKNIVAKKGARKYQGGADSRYIVGVRHGKTKTNPIGKVSAYDKRAEDPFYFRFQELGFTAVGRRKSASLVEKARRKIGKPSYGRFIHGKSFLRNSLTASASATVDKIRQVLTQEVAKLA